MKIKEAAQVCGLTEKAIRLYEAKGLIHPRTEEKNGRTFREYDEDTGPSFDDDRNSRSCGFSMEQIGIMQENPRKIGEVFSAYRETVRENAHRLEVLNRVISLMDVSEITDLDRFAEILAEAMVANDVSSHANDEIKERTPVLVQFRNSVWDEDLTAEEKENAFRMFWAKNNRREERKEVLFYIPRKIGVLFRCLKKKTDAKIRDSHGKMKGIAKVSIALSCVICILLVGWGSSLAKIQRLKDECAAGIFYAMHDVVYALGNTVRTGEYTYGHSEVVCRNLALIDQMVDTADDLYYTVFNKMSRKGFETKGLIDAMGSTYSGWVNNDHTEAILFDGVLSENEDRFIRRLYAEMTEVYSIMLDEDGINCRSDLDYDMIRVALHEFFEKWGEWRDMNYDTPYALLKRE